MVMMATMTPWPTTTAASDSRAAGRWRIVDHAEARVACTAGRVGPAWAGLAAWVKPGSRADSADAGSSRCRFCATSNGSGRSSSAMSMVAAMKPAAEKTNGPAIAGIPSHRPTVAPGPVRFGPSTEPTVVDQTTMER